MEFNAMRPDWANAKRRVFNCLAVLSLLIGGVAAVFWWRNIHFRSDKVTWSREDGSILQIRSFNGTLELRTLQGTGRAILPEWTVYISSEYLPWFATGFWFTPRLNNSDATEDMQWSWWRNVPELEHIENDEGPPPRWFWTNNAQNTNRVEIGVDLKIPWWWIVFGGAALPALWLRARTGSREKQAVFVGDIPFANHTICALSLLLLMVLNVLSPGAGIVTRSMPPPPYTPGLLWNVQVILEIPHKLYGWPFAMLDVETGGPSPVLKWDIGGIISNFIAIIICVTTASFTDRFTARFIRCKVGDFRAERGLCRNCAYNLAANVSGVCPECGSSLPVCSHLSPPR